MHREIRDESFVAFQIILTALALIGTIYILRRFLLKKYNEFMKKSDEILKLNVGGTMFHTRKETILCFYDKLSPPDKDVIIFIDRSPKHFDYILNYLRNHPTTLPPIFPESIREKAELEREAYFYNLHEIKAQLWIMLYGS